MRVHTTGDVEEYAAAAEAFLEDGSLRAQRAADRHGPRARGARRPTARPPSFWWVTDSDAVVGAASWTPPYNLLVSSLPPDARRRPRRGRDRARDRARPPARAASSDPPTSARAVAAAWTAATDDTIERDRPILLNELGSLTEVPVPPGARRRGVARGRAADRRVARGVQRRDRAHGPDRRARDCRSHGRSRVTSTSGSSTSRSSAWSVIGSPPACCASGPCTRRPSTATTATRGGSPTRSPPARSQQPGRHARHALHRCSQSCLELDLPAGRL